MAICNFKSAAAFKKKRIAVLMSLLSCVVSAEARFPGTNAFYSLDLERKIYLSVWEACNVALKEHGYEGIYKVVSASRWMVNGSYPSEPEGANESISCNVEDSTGAYKGSLGGVSRWYVCPSTARMVSTRPDGQEFLGQVACECVGDYVERYGQCVDAAVADQAISADKNTGGGLGCSLEGNPVNPSTGNKFLSETDYFVPSTGMPLEFSRTYNSSAVLPQSSAVFSSGLVTQARRSVLGNGWRHNYERALEFDNSNVQDSLFDVGSVVRVVRAQGGSVSFTKATTGYTAEPDVSHTLTDTGSGTARVFSFFDADANQSEKYDYVGRLIEIANPAGWKQTFTYSNATTPLLRAPAADLLLTVSDLSGRKLEFYYDQESRLQKLIDPAQGNIVYAYDDQGNLTKLTYQDLTTKEYRYGEPGNLDAMQDDVGNLVTPNLPYALTGIIDEDLQRFANYRYRADGKAVSTEHAGGAQKYQFAYNPDGTVSVTQPLGGVRVHSYVVKQGNKLPAGVDKSCAAGGANTIDFAQADYDASGNANYKQNFRGYRTSYTYNARNLETTRIEGLSSTGTSLPETRKITTDWHAQWSKPAKIAEPLKLSTYTYDTAGNLKTLTEQATTDQTGNQGLSATVAGTARTWTMTYETFGQVKTIDGPRTDVVDVTTNTYYPMTDPDLGKRGNLATSKNALGHETQITAYNAHGQPVTIIDPNLVTISLQYDDRQRLKQRTEGGELTKFDYYPTGLLKQVTLPDSSTVVYTYDTAHRLTGIADNLGNSQTFTLDAAGNRKKEEVRDGAGNLARQLSRVYNTYARLEKELGASNELRAEYTYDLQGNLNSIKTPLGAGMKTVINAYDPLNRLSSVTEQGLQTAKLGYNAQDRMVSYIDPRLLVMSYTIDGLGNQSQSSSPDAGSTVSHHDAAGNEIDRTDGKAQKLIYKYDELNRLIKTTYPDASVDNYVWDQGSNGKGRLTRIEKRDAANNLLVAIDRGYDPLGRMTSEARTVANVTYTTQYRYINGRLVGMTYPSGKKIDYTLNALGQITDVKLTNGTVVTSLASAIGYHPFGGIKSLTNGAGQLLTWGEDQNGRPSVYALDGKNWQVTYDNTSRVSIQQNLSDATQIGNYVYDSSDRLLQATLPSVTYGYTYDNGGNRLTQTSGSSTRTYAVAATSNRLQSVTGAPSRVFTYDANGSVEQDGTATYGYDNRGRIKSATVAGSTTNYLVDPTGFRVRKSGVDDTVFHYDLSGHLLGESDPAGAIRKEYIWVGNQPLAVIQ